MLPFLSRSRHIVLDNKVFLSRKITTPTSPISNVIKETKNANVKEQDMTKLIQSSPFEVQEFIRRLTIMIRLKDEEIMRIKAAGYLDRKGIKKEDLDLINTFPPAAQEYIREQHAVINGRDDYIRWESYVVLGGFLLAWFGLEHYFFPPAPTTPPAPTPTTA